MKYTQGAEIIYIKIKNKTKIQEGKYGNIIKRKNKNRSTNRLYYQPVFFGDVFVVKYIQYT